MEPFLADTCGNASGSHAAARAAKTALEAAREQVAASLGARPDEVVFTGSGTEADNLAVKGAARAARAAGGGDGVVTTAFEHKAVLGARRPARAVRGAAWSVRRSTPAGIVDLDALADALDDRTVLVSVMLVNNEVGTIQPLDEVADLVAARAPRAVLHTDAVQAVPWIDVAAASAARRPRLDLGAQVRRAEGRRRARAAAAAIRARAAARRGRAGAGPARRHVERRRRSRDGDGAAGARRAPGRRGRARRARCATGSWPGSSRRVPDCELNGDPDRQVAGTVHVGFPGVEAEALLVLARPGRGVRGRRVVVLVRRDRAVARARGHGPRPRRRAGLDPVELGYPSTDADVDAALDVGPRRGRAAAGRPAGAGHERARPGRDERRGRLVGGRGAAARGRARRHRRHAEALGRRVRLGVLQRRRRRGRPPRRGPARHPALRLQLHRGRSTPTSCSPTSRATGGRDARTPASSATAPSSSAGCSSAADALGFDARRDRAPRPGRRTTAGTLALARGVDRAKDQSYVLYMLAQRELARVLLPIGELTKPEVREHAAPPRAAHRRQAGEHGGLLHHPRRAGALPRAIASAPGRAPIVDDGRRGRRAARRRRRVHGRAAARPRSRRGRAPLRRRRRRRRRPR